MGDENEELQGTLGALTDSLRELSDPSTTPVAQQYATRILNQRLSDPYSKEQDALVTDLEKQTLAAQQTLKAAREKLLARRYNPSDAWFALAAAFGAPTETGSLGEALSKTAGAMREPLQKKFEFKQARDKEALDYERQSEELGTKLSALKLGLLGQERTAEGPLAVEALKTLGKRTSTAGTVNDKAAIAVDKAYAPEYLEWIQGGEPEAKQSLTELANARDHLRGFKIDPQTNEAIPFKKQPPTTGPLVGSLATLPIIGKPAQDILFPHSANTQEMVESTVQRSLRPILGAQFTEKEGERLISRVYNVRLRPEINAQRLNRLMNKLAVAYENKKAASAYFQEHGTLSGYTGQKWKYRIDDFMPDSSWEGENRGTSEEADDEPPEGRHDQARGDDLPAVVKPKPGQKVITYEEYLRTHPKAKRRYAQGGSVEQTLVKMPDGSLRALEDLDKEGDQNYEDLNAVTPTVMPLPEQRQPQLDSARSALPGGVREAGAAGAGAAGALAALKAATSVRDMFGSGSAEQRLVRLLETAKLSPEAMATDVRRGQRSGVPSMALDAAPVGARELLGEALPGGGASTEELLNRLTQRVSGSRGRVDEQVNKALKPDVYLEKEKNLVKELGDNARPLYDAAYQKYPQVKSNTLFQLMDTPTGKKAVQKAVKAIRDKPGTTMGKTDAMGMVTKPSLEFLDEVKNQLDDLITKEEGSGANYAPTKAGRRMRDLRKAFVNELDSATTDPKSGVSAYAEARRQYAGDLEVLDALRSGRTDFNKMQPDEVAAIVKDMSFAEKDAYRTGVATGLNDMLAKPTGDINAARKLVGSPAMKAKLATLFDNPNQANVFFAALDRESKMHSQDTSLLQQRGPLAAEATRPNRKAEKIVETVGTKISPVQWALSLIRKRPGMTDKDSLAIVNALKSSTPGELTSMIKRLGPQYGRALKRRGRMGKAAALGATAGSLYELFNQRNEEVPEEEGLTSEQQAAAQKPAGLAKGGKVGNLLKLVEELKADKPKLREDQIQDQVRNLAVMHGANPREIWQMLTEQPAQKIPASMTVPAPAEKLAPYASAMDAEMEKLKASVEALNLRGDPALSGGKAIDPGQTGVYKQSAMLNAAAHNAYDQMMSDPTPDNLRRLQELVTRVQQSKRRGGPIGRQFGGMTNHG